MICHSNSRAKYQREISAANLTSVSIKEHNRLIVGQSVTLTLPSYNQTEEVIWAFRTEQLVNASRRFQFSCNNDNCHFALELEGRIVVSEGLFTLSNLQLTDAGYWLFLRSTTARDFELVDRGAFVELWPENQRLITYWKTSAFDDQEAVCKGTHTSPQ